MFPEIDKSVINKRLQGYYHAVLSGTLYEIFGKKLKRELGNDILEKYVNDNQKLRKIIQKGNGNKKGKCYGAFGYRPKYTGRKKWIPEDLRGKDDRTIIKSIVFQIYYGEVKSAKKYKRVFRKLFPEVLEVIHKIKKEGRNFAVELQKAESDAILGKVCKVIKAKNRRIPLFTVHDSILTTEEHVKKVKCIMKREIKKLTGFPVKIK